MMLTIPLLVVLAVVEVTTHGAVANDATSDSQAFRDAFAAAGSGDTVHAGAGTWDLPRIDTTTAVYVLNKTNVTFDGEGATTILKMAGGTHVGDYNAIFVNGGSGLIFKDFACDGNRSGIVSADEQTHCMVVQDTLNFNLHDATLSHAYGDGVKFNGDPITLNTVAVTDVTCDDNGRSGLAFHGGGDIVITRFTATNISDQGIDIEPGGGVGLEGFTVLDSYIGTPTTPSVAALSLSGGTADGTSTTGILVRNTYVGGRISGVNAVGVTLDHVTVVADNDVALDFSREYQNVLIDHCAIASEWAAEAVHLSTDGVGQIANVTIRDTRITAQHGNAIFLESGPGGLIVDNVTIKAQSPFAQGTGLYVATAVAAPPDLDSVTTTGLTVEGMRVGVAILAGEAAAPITNVVLAGTVTLSTTRATTGVVCANGTNPDFTGLIVTATTPSSGCP